MLDFDVLEKQLVEAVGEENIQGHAVKSLGPILGMLQSGADLETDVLQTIRSKAKTLTGPVRSWAYFVPAITDAVNSRLKAGKGIIQPKIIQLDESDDKWGQRLKWARERETWNPKVWGPKPGEPGCKVPDSLMTENDGLGWRMTG